MDSWSEKQLKKMIVGGNGPCSAFLEEHGITPRTPIKVKYNSKAAEVYKTRIEALAEGKDWKPPANLAEMLKQASKPESSSPLKTNNQSRQNDGDKRSMKNSRGNSEDNDDWDDWGNAKSEPKSKNEPQSKRDAYFGKNQDSTPPSNARRQTTSSSSSPLEAVMEEVIMVVLLLHLVQDLAIREPFQVQNSLERMNQRSLVMMQTF